VAGGVWKCAVVGVAVLVAPASPAYAGSAGDDAKFLAALGQAGIGYNSPAQAIAVGNAVCQLLAAGRPAAEITWELVISNQGVSRDAATKFAAIAANAYCPQYLDNLTGAP
jgi:hypothetical protein